MSRHNRDEVDPARGNTRVSEGSWTKVGVVVGILSLIVTIVVALVQAGFAAPAKSDSTVTASPSAAAPPSIPNSLDPSTRIPRTDSGKPSTSVAPRSEPTLRASPAVVDYGSEIFITGSEFPPVMGLHIRLFQSNKSISYELGRDIIADDRGQFQFGGLLANPGYCGTGIIAAFVESGSAIGVPDFSNAIATVRVGVRCP